MKRRTALLLAGASRTGFAGCLSADDGTTPRDTDTDTHAPTAPPTGTASATPTVSPTSTAQLTPDTPRIVDRSFQVTGTRCGEAEDGGAHTTLDAPQVTVEGTVVGSNGCETARLHESTYDSDSDTLTVVVGVARRTGTEGCTQCLTAIDYRLTVRFEGGTPGHVRVAHDDAVVEESTPG